MGGTELGLAGKDWEESVRGLSAPWCPHLAILAPAPRMYRVYGKKNVKLEPVPLKGASLDPR